MAGNGKICSCGQHQGIGFWPDGRPLTPADRAARYKDMLAKIPGYVSSDQLEYLKSFERAHGAIQYDMLDMGHRGSGGASGMPKGNVILAPVARDSERVAVPPENKQPSLWYAE